MEGPPRRGSAHRRLAEARSLAPADRRCVRPAGETASAAVGRCARLSADGLVGEPRIRLPRFQPPWGRPAPARIAQPPDRPRIARPVDPDPEVPLLSET